MLRHEGLSRKKSTPTTPDSAFDAGSWAAILSLFRVLQRNGVLTDAMLAEIGAEMGRIERSHREVGLPLLADAVRAATAKVAPPRNDVKDKA